MNDGGRHHAGPYFFNYERSNMKYKIEFQQKHPGDARPEDVVQDDPYISEDGESLPIPDVGDSVSLEYGGKPQAFKVLTRHFSYCGDFCAVNIVVAEISPDEMASRLKE